ncbi:MAG TPA: cytochrome c biogenesis protein CcsA [Fimbriimonadaceae bacterium]|nr:cytochrome c biogenesis protein CcsA [Fimbriimonadaceae bacterium]
MSDRAPALAAPWSLFVGDLGRAFVIVALLACVVSAVLFITKKNERWAARSFTIGALGFVGAFASLAVLFVTHQFQYAYVFEHSALNHEIQYLIAGVWSGQQGSFLLWGTMSAIAGAFAVRGTGKYRRWFTIVYAVFLACIAGILMYESPFIMVPQSGSQVFVPLDGNGLSPSLLNYWVVVHPPTIFFGFGTLTVLFAYSLSAMIERDVKNWIPLVRPWAVLSLAVLGVGLAMGGFWAYETLGWGGFWAWDPVENTSFVPWCAVIAFVHGMFVQQAKKKWFIANVFFAALPFILFCYGTFLTRSGVLGNSSVHSFAQMDSKALRLLIAVGSVAIFAFVGTLIWRWSDIKTPFMEKDPDETLLSRGPLYAVGAWFLLAFAIFTAVGMSVPFMTALMGRQVAPDEGLYHQVLVWLFPPLMLTMAIAPYVSWKKQGATDLFSKMTNSLAVSLGLVGFLLLWLKSPSFQKPPATEAIPVKLFHLHLPVVTWILILTWLCMFVAVSSLWRFLEHIRKSKMSAWAMMAHFGLALALMGLIFSRGFEQKVTIAVHNKETTEAFGRTLLEKGQTSVFSDRNNKIAINVSGPEGGYTAKPGLYYVPGKDKPMAVKWPYIHHEGLIDYYYAIGEPVFDATGESEFYPKEQAGEGHPNLRAYKGFTLQYESFQMEGKMGSGEDVTMTARFMISDGTDAFEVEPGIVITKDGQRLPILARIQDTYTLELTRVDPSTKAVSLIIHYINPAYPMEVYFKPLTLFVWLGIGIMGLGGLLAAAGRRREARAIARSKHGAETTSQV